MVIQKCYGSCKLFDTGDDAVNFASGMGQPALDNNQRSSSNVWVVNNFIREAHGGAIAAGVIQGIYRKYFNRR